MSEIVAFLGSVPALIGLLKEVWALFNKLAGNDPASFIKKSHEAISELTAAKTSQEKSNAASKIQDLIRGL